MSLLRQLGLGMALLAALWGWHAWTSHQLAEAHADAAFATAKAARLAGELQTARTDQHIVTQYVDRIRVVQERGATITREVPIYVTRQADAQCVVPRGFVRVHDAAAAGTDLPTPAGSADAAPSGLALSTVAGGVVDNYTTCHATAARLTALQAWVRAHVAQATGPPP